MARGKLSGARTRSESAKAPAATGGRAERRILLPSNRVAVFHMPNVGEFLDLRGEAIRVACARSKTGKPSDAEIGMELGKLVLRRLLVGMTDEPVPLQYKGDFSPERDLPELRAKLEADNEVLVERGEPTIDVEATLNATEDAAEDTEAIKEAARPATINDLTWDEQEGAVGEYLARLPTSGLDTVEGRDWESLSDYSAFVVPQAMRGLDGPKAGQPRIRSLR